MQSTLKKGGDFNATGIKSSIPGSTTTSIPGRVVLVSKVIPSGATAYLKFWSAKVIDVGNADQVYFAITRNGTPIQSGMERIPGFQFDYQAQIEMGILVRSGLIEIVGYNISGMLATIESDALAVAVAVNCQAWWIGDLLSERGGIQL